MDELPKPVGSFLPNIKTEERPASCEKHGDYISKGFSLGRRINWIGCPDCERERIEQVEAESASRRADEAQKRMEYKLCLLYTSPSPRD